MTPTLRAWLSFVKMQPCCVPGCHEGPPCDAAHVRVLLSSKTGGLLGRSHKGRAAWAAIPLCKTHHQTGRESVHSLGEATFSTTHGVDYGRVLATLLVRFFAEGDR